MKATIVVSESVDAEITGKHVSIAVAALGAIASKCPMYFAIKGIVISAIISLTTFDKNASADNSVEYVESIIEESVYHPSPDPIAPASLYGNPINGPATIPPTTLPIIITRGISSTLNPKPFNLSSTSLCFPISIPTKNNNNINPISIIISVDAFTEAGKKKYPIPIPEATDSNILRLNLILPS